MTHFHSDKSMAILSVKQLCNPAPVLLSSLRSNNSDRAYETTGCMGSFPYFCNTRTSISSIYRPLVQPLRELEVLFLGRKQLVVVLRLARLRAGAAVRDALDARSGCG